MASGEPVDAQLVAKIRSTRNELKRLKKQPDSEEAAHIKELDLSGYLAKYLEVSGRMFSLSLEEQAAEFCEDLFQQIDTEPRDAAAIARFYDASRCSSLIIGYGTINGRDSIVNCVMVRLVAVEQIVCIIVINHFRRKSTGVCAPSTRLSVWWWTRNRRSTAPCQSAAHTA